MDCSAPGSVLLSFIISQSLLKLMSIKSVMPSNHLILCHPFLLPPSIFPSIKVFSNESALSIKWPEYWSFGFNISPSNEYSRLFQLGLTGLISLQSKGLSRVFINTTVQKHWFLGPQSFLWSSSHIHTWLLKKPSFGYIWTSLVAQMVKRLSTMWETWVQALGWKDPLEKEMAIHSSTIAWKIPWTEEPGRLWLSDFTFFFFLEP